KSFPRGGLSSPRTTPITTYAVSAEPCLSSPSSTSSMGWSFAAEYAAPTMPWIREDFRPARTEAWLLLAEQAFSEQREEAPGQRARLGWRPRLAVCHPHLGHMRVCRPTRGRCSPVSMALHAAFGI